MKLALTFSSLLLFATCQAQTFFVGTYTINTNSKGIYKYELKKDGTFKCIGLAATSINPSFLAWSADKKTVLAVNETSSGTVESYSIAGNSLTLINRQSSAGADPCFVATNKAGFVVVANYSSGNVGLLRQNQKGELSELLDVEQHTGKGTTTRQESPHAHSAWFEPNTSTIISVDLGTNELWFSNLDTLSQKLQAANPRTIKMKVGAAPRHLAFHANNKWIYVINELDFTVTFLRKNEKNNYEKVSSILSLPASFKEPNTSADIHISADGNFIYVSNRGHNSISIFEINTLNGSLKLIDIVSSHGKDPRNFALSPDENYIVVANQNSNNLVSFRRDKITGKLTYITEIEAPTPVCILF